MKKSFALTMCLALALPMLANAEPADKEEKEARKALRKAQKEERKAEREERKEGRQDPVLRAQFPERRDDSRPERREDNRPERRDRNVDARVSSGVEAQPVIAPTVAPQVQPRYVEDQPREFERRRIERRGPRSHAWSYDEARRYQHRERRDRSWWRSNYSRFALFGGGYYYWDRGYWYPAYGYDPAYSRYTYDEPIYGYNYMEPRQVMVRVQRELRREGYYRGAIDGLIGPMTRAALARFQRDAGLRVTRRIDGPTLAALGVV